MAVAISTAEGGGSSVNANINVTPMIDVMLVLLIIFMILTPLIAAGMSVITFVLFNNLLGVPLPGGPLMEVF